MNKRALTLTAATLGSLILLGCNNDSNNDTETTNTNTGDTLILTNNGMISSIDRMMPNKIVSNLKITGLQTDDELVGIDYRPKDGKLYAVGLLGNIYTLNPATGSATFIKKFSVHDKFHRTLILSGFCLLKIAKISLNSSFFPKPIKR